MSEPVGVHAMPPWADTRSLSVCPSCHMKPKPGERHEVVPSTTDDGEPTDVVCLDELNRVIYLPAYMHTPATPDPWTAPQSDWPDPPF